jgi:flavorubredoxin
MIDPRPWPVAVRWVGVDHPERRVFDELIPLPDGTSYNAWLVRGETRTALIDTVEPEFGARLLANLSAAGVERLDYVVCNHAEQDHSGSLPLVLAQYPEARVVTNRRCADMLVDLLDVPRERVQVVGEDDALDLGGVSLRFLITPWVHWPETMLTWCPEVRALFPCDFFGAHLPCQGLSRSWDEVAEAAHLYYATIMAPFGNHVRKHLARVRELQPAWLFPSHGPAHADPAPVLAAHQGWASGPTGPKVLLAYVSMHGSTRLLVQGLAERLAARGVPHVAVDLGGFQMGRLAIELLDSSMLVLGASNVLNAPHPAALLALALLEGLKPPATLAAVLGSYGWNGKPLDDLAQRLAAAKLELLPSVLTKGLPKAETQGQLDALADAIVERNAGFVAN